ncbi:hypothetical protein LSTR_LSTR001133 [Laodelphax striatellus]|uniref:Membrane protein BRI3 n=1 Tax=Laodelphax striatellus TaxID=195883 RepID=A0A482X1S3_LAOST|nr:hypothetical protein LSTR_LSTR001133 [Laodelphax striatellus]
MSSEYEKPPPYSPNPPAQTHPPTYQSFPPLQPMVQQNPIPGYGSTVVTIEQQPRVIIIGTCPACRVGIVEDDYTCLGIFCAIFFFPIGILACLLLKNRRCSNCGAYFG